MCANVLTEYMCTMFGVEYQFVFFFQSADTHTDKTTAWIIRKKLVFHQLISCPASTQNVPSCRNANKIEYRQLFLLHFHQTWCSRLKPSHRKPRKYMQIFLKFLRSGLLAGHKAGVMKSGVSWVNRCTVSRALWAGALCLAVVCNAILETEIFCRQYLNINNSCNK